MTQKKPDLSDLNALALEACDMWQEHLSSMASDPKSRADLTRFLEPQRRFLSDWASLMQHSVTPQSPASSSSQQSSSQQGGRHDPDVSAEREARAAAPKPESSRVSPSQRASDDNVPLRLAQLMLRMAELEKRIAVLEAGAAGKAV